MISLIFLGLLLVPFLAIGGGMALFWKGKRRSILRWSALSYLVTAILLFFGVAPYLAAWAITQASTRPPDRRLTDTPADYQLPFEEVSFESTDSLSLSGWFIPPTGKEAVLIGTHGLFRNRIELLARSAPLCREGYGALLYDSRSHGSSARGLVSLGYHERNDILGAIRYIENRFAPEPPRIVLMGVSMGAVTTLEAAAESDGYAAIILDSPFAGFSQTIEDHSWLLLGMPRFPFASLVEFWFGRLAGFDPAELDSCAALKKARSVPLLVIASQGDRRIPSAVSGRLYEDSRSPVKRLKIFGADVPHGASARLHPEEYGALLMEFLDEALVRRSHQVP
jgi:alpha-beta hydrolase superfamily lysophospholipase